MIMTALNKWLIEKAGERKWKKLTNEGHDQLLEQIAIDEKTEKENDQKLL